MTPADFEMEEAHRAMYARYRRQQRVRHAIDVLFIALGLIVLFAVLAGAGWTLWELYTEKGPAVLLVLLATAGLIYSFWHRL